MYMCHPATRIILECFLFSTLMCNVMGLSDLIFCVLGGLAHFIADKIVMKTTKTILSCIMKRRC